MDRYIIVVSDGEQSQTIECGEHEVAGIVSQFVRDEYLMVATIVKVLVEEKYEN